MLFKILIKDAFAELVGLILESNEDIGSKRVATSASGKHIHQYLPVTRFDELELLCSMLVRSYDPCISCSVH
jgi:Ni,Fe-hydrogenase I large subunit